MQDTGRFSKRVLCRWLLVIGTGLPGLPVPEANSDEARPVGDTFMVIDRGTAMIGADGEELERLSATTHAAGALSPDGHWIAFSESRKVASGSRKGNLIIQSRLRSQERTIVPLVWGGTGSSFLPLWSADSHRILICEQGTNDTVRESAYRIYDLAKKDLTDLKLPKEWWPSDWSADGKRILMTLKGRVAWGNIDGTGEPEFITPEREVAYNAQLSPDGRRILCLTGPRRPNEERRRLRLSVFDLETRTNKRSFVDEPGETNGYCWSPDGSRVAYTWQRSLDAPADVAVRETFLMTCDPDGSQRKTVTSRKYEVPLNSSGRDGIVIFFEVLAWR